MEPPEGQFYACSPLYGAWQGAHSDAVSHDDKSDDDADDNADNNDNDGDDDHRDDNDDDSVNDDNDADDVYDGDNHNKHKMAILCRCRLCARCSVCVLCLPPSVMIGGGSPFPPHHLHENNGICTAHRSKSVTDAGDGDDEPRPLFQEP